MQSRLFHYEILRSLPGASFEARDLRSGAPAILHEWTPPADERDAARERLAAHAAGLGAEVFSVDASLYLAAASPSAAADALRRLGHDGLFPGSWGTAPPSPAAPPPTVAPEAPLAAPFRSRGAEASAKAAAVPPRPLEPAPARPRSRSGLVAFGFLLVGAGAFGAGLLLGGDRVSTPQTSEAVDRGAGAVARQATQLARLQAQLLAAHEQLAEQSSASAGVHLLRIHNGCSLPVRVAVAFTGFNGQGMVEGWVTVPPGSSPVVAASPSREFHFYAEVSDGSQSWGTPSSLLVDTVPDSFVYPLSAGLADAEKTSHGTQPVRVEGAAPVFSLSCSTAQEAAPG